jgi:hypothetical protein
MKTPTRKQRLQIYKEALEIRLNGMYEERVGLCSTLTYAPSNPVGRKNHRKWNAYYEMKAFFPEIYKQKPNEQFENRYWFETNNESNYERIKILKTAIEELEVKLAKLTLKKELV